MKAKPEAKFFITLGALLMSLSTTLAQVNIKDSAIATPLISISYGYQLPGADMAKRFGNNSSIQFGVEYKTRHQWMLGINGSYLFGKRIKEATIFDSIDTSEGYIINNAGNYADVRLYERGFTIVATAGRMFAFKKPNPNSGIIVNLGIGFMQHKIRIETIGNDVPQLTKQYKKGYDKLSNGLLLTQDIGYMFLGNTRLANFYFGFQFMEGFTQSRRSFDYELMKQDTQKRLDMLYGGKVAWILPLYKKAPQEFYVY